MLVETGFIPKKYSLTLTYLSKICYFFKFFFCEIFLLLHRNFFYVKEISILK